MELFTDTNDDAEGREDEEGEDDEDMDDDQDWESENEYEDEDDDMGAMTGQSFSSGKKTVDPFAPAEMYLSDMIHNNNQNDDNLEDFLVVNVSNYLIFSPPSADPLSVVDLQGAVIELLTGLQNSNVGGIVPPVFPPAYMHLTTRKIS